MRSKVIVGSLLALTALFAGCMGVVPGAQVERGTVAFTAEASVPLMKADDAMALVEARTAAAAMARAELLAKIKGAVVEGAVQVKDLAFATQQTNVHVDGMISRVQIEYPPMERTGPMAQVVTAVARLEMTCEEYKNLHEYVH
jgi:hypothetical protein